MYALLGFVVLYETLKIGFFFILNFKVTKNLCEQGKVRPFGVRLQTSHSCFSSYHLSKASVYLNSKIMDQLCIRNKKKKNHPYLLKYSVFLTLNEVLLNWGPSAHSLEIRRGH